MWYISLITLFVSFSQLCEVAHASRLRSKMQSQGLAHNVSIEHHNVAQRRSIDDLVDAAAERVIQAHSRNFSQQPINMSLKSKTFLNSSFFNSGRYTMNGAVIFLHGEDQTAAEYRNAISGLVGLEDMLVENGFMPLFPDAELQQQPPSTEFRALWFVNDEGQSGPGITEADWSMRRAYNTIIGPMIQRMSDRYSVPVHKVLVGGFSRGGDMGLQMLRLNPDIGGFFSIAGYLPDTSAVYSAVASASKTQPVFMAHGSLDDVVPIAWGTGTRDKLIAEGAQVNFTLRDSVGHWQDQIMLAKLQDWIVKTYSDIWEAEDSNAD